MRLRWFRLPLELNGFLRERFSSRRPSVSKTIMITGASSGFGRDTAEPLARAGHTVHAV